jgi:hypothetical protein
MAAKKTAKKITETTAKPAAKKTVTKVAEKTVTAEKKTPAKKTAAPAVAKSVIKKAPSLDEVARAAYLNYRSRVERGLPGDCNGDWLEAERVLSELS